VGVINSQQEAAEALAKEKIDLTLAFLRARIEMPFASFDAPKGFDGIDSKSCEFEYVICCQMGGKYHVIGKLPAEIEVENYAVKQFSTMVTKNLEMARERVAELVEHSERLKKERIDGYQQLRKDAAPESKLGIPQ